MNNFDLDIAIRCKVCTGGVDMDLYDEYNRKDELRNIIIQADQWGMYQEYELRLKTLIDYSRFTQHSIAIVHHDIFEYQSNIELLIAQ